MARNIEIKARIASVEALAPRVTALAQAGPTAIGQDDTFFPCPNGWLKLRELPPTESQLLLFAPAITEGSTTSGSTTFPPTIAPFLNTIVLVHSSRKAARGLLPAYRRCYHDHLAKS